MCLFVFYYMLEETQIMCNSELDALKHVRVHVPTWINFQSFQVALPHRLRWFKRRWFPIFEHQHERPDTPTTLGRCRAFVWGFDANHSLGFIGFLWSWTFWYIKHSSVVGTHCLYTMVWQFDNTFSMISQWPFGSLVGTSTVPLIHLTIPKLLCPYIFLFELWTFLWLSVKTPPKLRYLCRLQTADIWIFIATLPWCTLVAKESSGKVLAPSSTHGGKEHQFGLYDMGEQTTQSY